MELTEKWRIVNDENNVTLQFFETRLRNKGEENEVEFEFVDSYYYPNVKSALIAFLQKYIKGSKDVSEVLSRINDVENLIINRIKN